MSPNQNQFPAPPNPGEPGHDPYAFFMDPQHQPKKSLFKPSGGPSGNKLLIAVAAVAAVVIVIILATVLSAGSKQKTQGLLSLAQTQQEVIRVATDGTKNAQSTVLKNFATNTVVSLNSDQRLLLAQIQKDTGKKFQTKDLELGKNPQTDQALSAAQAANTYDVTFASTMDSELDTYQNKLEETAKGATSPAGISLLKKEIDNAAALRKQVDTQIKP